MVLPAPPAVIGLVARSMVDCAADTAAGLTTTDAVCVMDTLLTVAETVSVSALVDATVPVVTPTPLVVAGCVTVLPVPLDARHTVAPLIRLLNWSFAVTVIVLPVPPAVIGLEADTVDVAAETTAGLTVTVAVCVTATTPIVAETVFASATVDANVPVICPSALVVPTGWVSVLPVPVDASVTLAPLTGLPNWSFAVTVMVLPVPPAVIGLGDAVTVDCAARYAGRVRPPPSPSA